MFITVEGVIGVGKTTATRLLAEAFGGTTLFEIVEENPFLRDFYADKDAWALQTETFFLLNRVKQLEDTEKQLKAGALVVSDYNVIKNRIFAGLTLTGVKREKYMQLFDILTGDLPGADLVIYLRAEHETVMSRIRHRGRMFESNMDPGYIRSLAAEYDRAFEPQERIGNFGAGARVTVFDTTNLNLVDDPSDQQWFLQQVEKARRLSPAGSNAATAPG